MAIEKPEFIVKGLRNFSERTLKIGLVGVGIGFFFPPVLGLSLGLSAVDIAINTFTASPKMARAAA